MVMTDGNPVVLVLRYMRYLRECQDYQGSVKREY